MKDSIRGCKKIAVVGAGIGGLTAAALLAQAGHQVAVFEKNDYIGGRAASFRSNGFTFDIGPTWYGDVAGMEQFFAQFEHRSADFYRLVPLADRYQVAFADQTKIIFPADLAGLRAMCDAWEQGGARAVSRLVAQYSLLQQQIATGLWRQTIAESRDWATIQVGLQLATLAYKQSLRETLQSKIDHIFNREYLRTAFLAPFMGAGLRADQTAAIYAATHFAQFDQPPVYPLGGIGEVPKAIAQVGWEQGVQTHTTANVEQIIIANGKVVGLQVNGEQLAADAVVVAGDYEMAEQTLLASGWRSFPSSYWQSARQTESLFTLYLGLKKTLPSLPHHLYYCADSQTNSLGRWPSEPSFYCTTASRTDWQVAPKGGEAIRLNTIVDSQLIDTEVSRQKFFIHLVRHFEAITGLQIQDAIVYQRVFSHQHARAEWGSERASMLGMAPSPTQLFWRRPPGKSKRVKGLYFVGQAIDPGPGLSQVMAGAQRVTQWLINDVQYSQQ